MTDCSVVCPPPGRPVHLTPSAPRFDRRFAHTFALTTRKHLRSSTGTNDPFRDGTDPLLGGHRTAVNKSSDVDSRGPS